jgi:hypothetical protein
MPPVKKPVVGKYHYGCEVSLVTLPNGERLDVYSINALANALQRNPRTLQRWEQHQLIPPPFFRIFKKGRRLRFYSQEQIDIMVQCAEEAGVLDTKKRRKLSRVNLSVFSQLCYKRLGELRERYAKTD